MAHKGAGERDDFGGVDILVVDVVAGGREEGGNNVGFKLFLGKHINCHQIYHLPVLSLSSFQVFSEYPTEHVHPHI